MTRPEMLYNSFQRQNSTTASSASTGTPATKKEEKKEGELEANKGEKTSGAKKMLKGPGKNQPTIKTEKEETGTKGTNEVTEQTEETEETGVTDTTAPKDLNAKGPDRETMGIAIEITTEGSGSKTSLERARRHSGSRMKNTDDGSKM